MCLNVNLLKYVTITLHTSITLHFILVFGKITLSRTIYLMFLKKKYFYFNKQYARPEWVNNDNNNNKCLEKNIMYIINFIQNQK